ncbi:MAG: tape measure protein, partial [Gammaproteobacteria bacterium]|nr:tape measure protein [Gammaproteobacteria bacterium]
MDYQTKITVDADRALRNLEKLEKVFHRNDDATVKLKKALSELTKEKKRLEIQTKKSTNIDKKSIQAQKELAAQLRKMTALTSNEVANSRHKIAIDKAVNASAAKLAKTYKLFGITLDGNSLIVKRSIRDSASFTKRQNELVKAALKVNKALNLVSISTNKYNKSLRRASVSNKSLQGSLTLTNKFLRSQLILFRAAMLAATAYAGIKTYIEVNKTAESVDLLNKKLQTFTGTADTMEVLKASALKTGFAIQDMGRIVTRFAVTTEGAFDSKTLVKWTEGLIMSARAVGTTTMELNNALIQLSQSFSAGYLMGDEYRSISENLPLFKLALRDVADEAGYAGVSLKELSSGRKLDIDLLVTALEKLSNESMRYTFALDNIEAAEARVRIGWELWMNSIINSRALKDALNIISGALIQLSGDQTLIEQFRKQFPQMTDSVKKLTVSIRELMVALKFLGKAILTIGNFIYDFIEILYENKAILVALSGGFVIFKLIKALVLLQASFASTSVATGVFVRALGYLIAFSTPLGTLAAAAVAAGTGFAVFAYKMTSWVQDSIQAREELAELNRTIFESDKKMESLVRKVSVMDLENLDLASANLSIDNMKNSANALSSSLTILQQEKEKVIQKFKSAGPNADKLNAKLRALNDEEAALMKMIFTLGLYITKYEKKAKSLKTTMDNSLASLKNFVDSIGIPPPTNAFANYIEGLKDLDKE